MELKQKGENAQLGGFKQLKLALVWTSAVDLDLMAFYKTKDGRVGGVYSENYAGGSLGSLNMFPHIALSGDEGVGATGGDNREEIQVSSLDEFEEICICALNFTDASAGSNRTFADFDARVELSTDGGDSHTVRLDSRAPGSVAVLCKLQNNFMGASVVNDSEVMNLDNFRAAVPGADKLQLSSKVTLKSKGDSFAIKPKGASGEVLINLNWNQGKKGGFLSGLFGGGGGIDLDLGCFFEMTDGTKAAIQPLNVGFLKQGAFNQAPYIYHLGDDRSGGWSEGENIKVNVAHLSELRRILIYTYIYEGAPNWGTTDAVVTVKSPGSPVLEVRMGQENDPRPFCAIALLEMSGQGIKVTKLVNFYNGHPECDRAYHWGLEWTAGSK